MPKPRRPRVAHHTNHHLAEPCPIHTRDMGPDTPARTDDERQSDANERSDNTILRVKRDKIIA